MTYAISQSLFKNESAALCAPADEAGFIQTARRGDLDAFNSLVLLHQDRVYNLAYRILGDEAAAADATQEAFILAYRHIRHFHTGFFFAWLYRIVSNVCYDALRYQKRRPAVPFTRLTRADDEREFDLPATDDSPETVVQRHELADLLQQHIAALPADQRIALVLSDVQGLSYKEIADVTRSNLGTVKSRLNRARSRMRQSLSREESYFGGWPG
ncbi:MAG: sigma-70 family RNA polymerase sigma factor [Chloroflexi bacterium]|nr:sigma-70 family RNA polymerase sigma factor [Chloroflexota bacterium]